MGKIKGYVFDENGQRIIIDNIVVFISEMRDRLLVKTYKATVYQNKLISEIGNLSNLEKQYSEI